MKNWRQQGGRGFSRQVLFILFLRLQPHYVTIVEAAGDVSQPAAGDVSQPAETTAADAAADAAAGRAGGAAAGGGNQEVIQLEEVEVENNEWAR